MWGHLPHNFLAVGVIVPMELVPMTDTPNIIVIKNTPDIVIITDTSNNIVVRVISHV